MLVYKFQGEKLLKNLNYLYTSNLVLGIRKQVQSILIIWGFCICEFTYFLKLICNPKINTPVLFAVIHSHARAQSRENFESPQVHTPS